MSFLFEILILLFLSPVKSFSSAYSISRSISYRSNSNAFMKTFMSSPVIDKDKEEVTEYFNNNGFERWNKIYSESEDVNSVQKDIRDGHAQTVEKVLKWIDEDGNTSKLTFCDAGCGVGSLTIPLAQRGAVVEASDISLAMTTEAKKRSEEILGPASNLITFKTSDLESLSGKFSTVCCIDVMIHYPSSKSMNEIISPILHIAPQNIYSSQKMTEMVLKLCSMAENRVILSFAPDTWYYTLLKKIGSLFPGPSKTTRAYLHKEEDVIAAIKKAGFSINRTEFTGTSFYFSRILEAVKG